MVILGRGVQEEPSALAQDFRLDDFDDNDNADSSELAMLTRQLQNLRGLIAAVSARTFLASFDEVAFDIALPVLRSVRGAVGVAPLHALALAAALSEAMGEADPASLPRWCEAVAPHAIVGAKRARRWPPVVSSLPQGYFGKCTCHVV